MFVNINEEIYIFVYIHLYVYVFYNIYIFKHIYLHPYIYIYMIPIILIKFPLPNFCRYVLAAT